MEENSKMNIYTGITIVVAIVIILTTIAIILNNSNQESEADKLMRANGETEQTQTDDYVATQPNVDWDNATEVTGDDFKKRQEAFEKDIAALFGEDEKISNLIITAVPVDLSQSPYDETVAYNYAFNTTSIETPLNFKTIDTLRKDYIFHSYVDALAKQYADNISDKLPENVYCELYQNANDTITFGHIPSLDELVENDCLQGYITITIDAESIKDMDTLNIIDKAHDQLKNTIDALTTINPAFKNTSFTVNITGTSAEPINAHSLFIEITPASKTLAWNARTDDASATCPSELTYERALE